MVEGCLRAVLAYRGIPNLFGLWPKIKLYLNNLAQLLKATNRLGEAEPLLRRALAIFLAFQPDTGHAHPHRDAVTGNYGALLRAMGKSKAEIAAALAASRREAGLDPG
jgi:hypothetical protein